MQRRSAATLRERLERWGGAEKSLGATERDEFLRSAWRALVTEGTDPRRLVFVEAMGANVSLSPLYAWSRRGERAFGEAPRNCGKNVTLLASLGVEGMAEAHTRGAHRGDGPCARGGYGKWRPGLRRPLRIPSGGPTAMTNALGSAHSEERRALEGTRRGVYLLGRG